MKPLWGRKPDEEEPDFFAGSPRKDFSLGLIKLVTVLLIFMAGAVLGVSVSVSVIKTFRTQNDLFFPRTIFRRNCDRDCFGFRNFIRPRQLEHSMSDEQLFWRASMVPKKVEYPYKRVPKVAFMFLTRGPLPLAPLWERFFQGHEKYYSVYVHTLPNYKLNVSESSAFYGRQIPSEVVTWGDVSLVDAEKRLLANALLDFSNERFVLLSESCIPVFSFPMVYNYLINSDHSYVQSYDENTPQGRGRYNRRMSPEIELSQWRKGSEWFELNRELAVTMISETKYYDIFRKYCRPSCYPDEHYIPTYLNMFRGSQNSNRTVTWVDWSRGGPHPAAFGREDISVDFIKSIRISKSGCTYNNKLTSRCYLFARKFSPSALEPLLNISSTVMNF